MGRDLSFGLIGRHGSDSYFEHGLGLNWVLELSLLRECGNRTPGLRREAHSQPSEQARPGLAFVRL
jgi:hypothetical protein